MDARTELALILDQARDYLNALKDEGVSSLDVALAEPGRRFAEKGKQTSPGSSAAGELNRIAAEAAACTKCGLHKTRTRAVPGQGNPQTRILFVGEAPGEEEDRQGLSFVGPAGQLLTQMIEAMGFKREDVFIGNILKCRPPANRTPLPDETAACLPYLEEQIRVLKPDVIVALGAVAARGLLRSEAGITQTRGRWAKFQGIDVMPTYHPAYLLRMPSAKHEAWKDLQEVCKRIGHTPPPVQKKSAASAVRGKTPLAEG